MPDRRLDASALREWADAAVDGLLAHVEEINRLNVFPVADADTGTNMLFTMRSALAEADSSGRGDPTATAAALARGAARGARGNSGLILSAILTALADVTAGAGAETDLADIDAAVLAAALRHGVALVVAAMGGVPVAGTMVSVLAAAAGAAEQAAGRGAGLPEALAVTAEAAATALDATTDQLAVLAEAGVVDAGGRGLLVLLDALTETVAGQSPSRRAYEPPGARPRPPAAAAPEFEVMYLAESSDAAALARLRADLEKIGDSVALTAAAAGRYSVHVHTDDAGAAIEAGLAAGPVSRIRVSALASGRVAPGGWSRERAVLAAVDGADAGALFRSEGAFVVAPDPELLDPLDGVSAAELLRALVDTGAGQVMVLPNGYISAEDLVAGCAAGIGCGIDVVPVPAGSMTQGLAALAVHDPGRAAVDDGYAMARAAAAARAGSVRVATESALTWAGPCEPGDVLGIAGGEVLVVAADPGAAGAALIDLLLGAGGELVTVLVGAAAPASVGEALAEHVRRRHPGTEYTGYRCGQRADLLLIGVE